MTERFDIIVAGGGIAGMTAAAAFGAEGFRVLIVDPAPPVTDGTAADADRRSTAFLQPARDTLAAAGIWQRLAADAAPLQVMRLADAAEDGTLREVVDFDAAEISEEPFGWNLPNWLLRREMAARLKELAAVDFRPGIGVARILTRTAEAVVTLSDGAQARAPLVLAADGRNSPIRQALGIDVHRWTYGQRAIVFSVSHPLPHNDVSTEVHRSGGPFTLVPLPDGPDGPHSAVVWMDTTAEAARRMALDDATFAAEATERCAAIQGPLTLTSPRAAWPIISQKAKSLTGERVALIAEAAHVVPPIGAQGLNMSLADIEVLLDLARRSPHALGEPEMLSAYTRRRAPDIAARVAGVDALNRASIAGDATLRALRLKGIGWLHGILPLRRIAMKAGLGA